MKRVRLTQAQLAEFIDDIANVVEEEFPDPNPLASLFKPYVGDQIVQRIRQMAREVAK